MDRHGRRCGTCALLAVATVAPAAGCGSGVLELLQPPPTMMVAGKTHHLDGPLASATGPAQAPSENATRPEPGKPTEAKRSAAATSGRPAKPDRPSDNAHNQHPATAKPSSQPPTGPQTKRRGNTESIGEHRGSGGPTAKKDTVRARTRAETAFGSKPAQDAKNNDHEKG